MHINPCTKTGMGVLITHFLIYHVIFSNAWYRNPIRSNYLCCVFSSLPRECGRPTAWPSVPPPCLSEPSVQSGWHHRSRSLLFVLHQDCSWCRSLGSLCRLPGPVSQTDRAAEPQILSSSWRVVECCYLPCSVPVFICTQVGHTAENPNTWKREYIGQTQDLERS